MKRKPIYLATLATVLTMALSSCVKDDLYNTPHPQGGTLTLTADWTDRGDGISTPTAWTVNMGDYMGQATSDTHVADYTFQPGAYQLRAWSTTDGINVNGATATVATAGDGTSLNSMPGWLFTATQEVTIEADTQQELTLAMHQQVRQLTLVIAPSGNAAARIANITGTLSGVAGSMDFASNTYSNPSSVSLAFTRISEGEDTGKWTATVRLLGTVGEAQRLTATLTYANDNPQPMNLESDLTSALASFNSNKTEPLTLGGTIAETPTEAGVEAGITDWEKIDGGGVDAEM